MRILVTGAAGFIGYSVSYHLLNRGDVILGIDNLNDYYDPTLKESRLKRISERDTFEFQKIDIADFDALARACREFQPQRIIHLAAQAGVRYSLENPHAYIHSNIVGFTNILEVARELQVEHLTYASSSSVYGANKKVPFSTSQNVDHPLSLYAASKKSNELMAHCYSHLYNLPTTGLRFFTVYGPWGRPDMALFLFTERILAGKPIQVFNYGNHIRDFTYIDDIVEGIIRISDKIAAPAPDWSAENPQPGRSNCPFRVYNIGNNSPVVLGDFITAIEEVLGIEAEKEMLPMAAGDVPNTYAEVGDLVSDVGFRPQTPVKVGITKFIDWYREYYGV